MTAGSNAPEQQQAGRRPDSLPPYRRQRGLSPKAHAAARLVASGQSDQDVADALGCHRVTVNRWRNQDAHFRAEVNRQLHDQDQAQVLKAEHVRSEALRVVGDAIAGGDANVALRFLRLSGPLGRPGAGPETPADVEHADAYRDLTELLSRRPTDDKDSVLARPLRELKDASRRAEAGWEIPLVLAGHRNRELLLMEVEGTGDRAERARRLQETFELVQRSFERSDGEGLRGLAMTTPSAQEASLAQARLCVSVPDPESWDDGPEEAEEVERLVRETVEHLLEAAEHWLVALVGAGEGAVRTTLPTAPVIRDNLDFVASELRELRGLWLGGIPAGSEDIEHGLAVLGSVIGIVIRSADLTLPDHEHV